MSRIQATFDGRVVAEPKEVNFQSGARLVEVPVYVNHRQKNRDTGEWEDSGDTSKIKVKLWQDLADSDVQKGDIVEVVATLKEREYERQDGGIGRSLETEFVDSIVVKHRFEDDTPARQPVATAQKGF